VLCSPVRVALPGEMISSSAAAAAGACAAAASSQAADDRSQPSSPAVFMLDASGPRPPPYSRRNFLQYWTLM
jgi:hypothetical protein